MKCLVIPVAMGCMLSILPQSAKGETTEDTRRAAKPLGDPGEWITPADYPWISLMNSSTGNTTFELAIDKEGVPSTCEILASSGDTALDTATCTLIKARARFEPFKDERGRAVPSTYRNRVRWVLPGSPNDQDDGTKSMIIEAEISSNGVVERCRIVQKDETIFGRVADPCPRWLGQQVYEPTSNQMPPRLIMKIKQSVEFELASKPTTEDDAQD